MAVLVLNDLWTGWVWASGTVGVTVGLALVLGTLVLMADGGSWFESDEGSGADLFGKRDRGLAVGCLLAGLLMSPLVAGNAVPRMYRAALVHDQQRAREVESLRRTIEVHLLAAQQVGFTFPGGIQTGSDAYDALNAAEEAGVTLSFDRDDVMEYVIATTHLHRRGDQQRVRLGLVGVGMFTVCLCGVLLRRHRGSRQDRDHRDWKWYALTRIAVIALAAGGLLAFGAP